MLENLRGSRNDMDFMVADFENGDNAKDILAQSDKEYTVIFSKEEMEKMASDPKYYAEKMHSIEQCQVALLIFHVKFRTL